MSAPIFRPYQSAAVEAAVSAILTGDHPVISLPTGAGKSLVVGKIVADLMVALGGRFLVVVPSRELAEQNERALHAFVEKALVGVNCASLGRREGDRQIVIGTPQSLATSVDFDPNCVLVDEAHGMPLHRTSWFARLFDRLPRGRATRRVGLSATTFRKADGAIYGQPDSWFTSQPFEIGVQELVDDGYLAPVRYVAPGARMTTRGITRTAGDYSQSELVQANARLVEEQVGIIGRALAGRRKAMIFAVNIEHATAYRDEIVRRGAKASLIVGTMSASERAAEVAAFKSGEARAAVTVSAALTGFDVPDIDVLACCRPTLSPIIHMQSIGRGTRPSPGKTDCLVLDFAGNVRMFGPVHQPHFDRSGQPLGGIAPWRPCPSCSTYAHFGDRVCRHCDAPLIVARASTAESLEFGTISFTKERNALQQLVRRHGDRHLPVESLALHAYRKASDPTQISCMISFGMGGDAIVRMWFKRMRTTWWRNTWFSLLGASPLPQTLQDAYARRHELVRPAFVDLSLESDFWRASNPDYSDDEQNDDDRDAISSSSTSVAARSLSTS